MINIVCFHGCGQTASVFQQLLKNLEKKITKKFDCKFHYIQGNHKLKEKGYSWYREPTKNNNWNTFRVNLQEREKRLSKTFLELKKLENVILIGFSEGAMYVLDLALKYSITFGNSIVGVISIAPPYSPDAISKDNSDIPCMIITSQQDQNVLTKESLKWEKHFTNVTKHTTDKGHKIHFPLNIREDIIKMMNEVLGD